MINDIIGFAKGLVRRVWALTVGTPAAPPERPQLNGRRGYGDGGIKPPE
jgi:hypothetical protein